jgi:hypothetical protein
MVRNYDTDSTIVTLDSSQSLSSVDDYLNVDVANADSLRIYIDSGTSGSAPQEYTLLVETRNEGAIQGWMQDLERTGQTAVAHNVESPGNEVRIDIENTSASNGAQYRIYVEATY